MIGNDINKIGKLKMELAKCFSMKDLGLAEHILRMKISRDRITRKLWLSQEN